MYSHVHLYQIKIPILISELKNMFKAFLEKLNFKLYNYKFIKRLSLENVVT